MIFRILTPRDALCVNTVRYIPILSYEKALLLGRVTSVAINPLLFAFLTIVAVKVLEVL